MDIVLTEKQESCREVHVIQIKKSRLFLGHKSESKGQSETKEIRESLKKNLEHYESWRLKVINSYCSNKIQLKTVTDLTNLRNKGNGRQNVRARVKLRK